MAKHPASGALCRSAPSYSLAALATAFLTMSPALATAATTAENAGSPAEDTRLDKSHKYVVQKSNDIAHWIDGFFGDVDTEEEAPYSTLRLRLENDWNEIDKYDFDVSVRGKIHLPALSERLSLIFSDSEDIAESDDVATDREDDSEDIALQYNIRAEDYDRFDIKLGIQSNGNLKTALRYKYERPFSESYIARFREELRYYGGEGFGSRTRIELDKVLTKNRLLRWSNRVNWDEEESGIDWSTSLSMNKRVSDIRAVSTFVSVSGETQPLGDVTVYGVGIRYRQKAFKPWMFLEVQPYYEWRKEFDMDDREGSAGLQLNLIAVFEKEAD